MYIRSGELTMRVTRLSLLPCSRVLLSRGKQQQEQEQQLSSSSPSFVVVLRRRARACNVPRGRKWVIEFDSWTNIVISPSPPRIYPLSCIYSFSTATKGYARSTLRGTYAPCVHNVVICVCVCVYYSPSSNASASGYLYVFVRNVCQLYYTF